MVETQPRRRDKLYKSSNKMGSFIPPEWGFDISVFKNYRYDTPKQFDRCFKFDWNYTKIPKFVKNPED